MIRIVEISPPRKMTGKSSFCINFDFNQAIVDSLKGLPTFYYHKKDYTWEIPINCISQALESLTFLDDIQLSLLPDDPGNPNQIDFKLTKTEIEQFRFTPFEHQIEGINFGLEKEKWLLLDNPGCGKTNQVIWYAETLKRRGLINHCLIIVGINSLRSNWKKEIQKFSKESCLLIGEKIKKDGTISKTPMSVNDRIKQLNQPIEEFFVILNVESFRNEKLIDAIKKGPNKFGLIAIDEVHKCLASGRSSTQGSNILKLDADFKVAASGTLLINNPLNCWGPLYWTENDRATLTTFKSNFCEFGGFNGSQVVGYRNLDVLKEELEDCSIRRSKEDLVDLPPKMITLEELEMSDEHRKFYEAVKNGVKEEADKIELKSTNLLALTTRLRQATACPEALTSQDILSTKVERCVEIVEDLMSQGEKVVILSTFKQPVYKLAELLKVYNPLVCTGDQAEVEVSAHVDSFQNDPNSKIIVGTLAKLSTGLTLNSASYMIMLDEHWTAAMNDQAQNRIYRLNNTNPAFITILACKDTIDMRVHEVAALKQELSDFIIDDIPSPKFTETLKSIISEL